MKKYAHVVLWVLAAGTLLAFRTPAFSIPAFKDDPPTKYEKILRNVREVLANIHYSPRNIDDNFSREVFTKYIAAVDPEKKILLQSDISDLRRFETTLDNEITGKAPVEFVPAVSQIYKQRLLESEAIYKDILTRPFDFTNDEYIDLSADRLDFPKTEADKKEALRKRMKYLALQKYTDLLALQESNKNKPGFVAQSNEELEKQARQATLKIMDRYYTRLKVKTTDDDRFNQFVETIVQHMDPHTDYFPPVAKRSYDEDMSGRYFGIGATLRDDDGAIKINTLIAGSPAWKSGQVNKDDAILKVAQGSGEPVDLTGYLVEDAIKIIRGAKGTEVKLTLKKTDGTIKTVSLIRDEVVQDETFARSVVINTDKGRIGYIFLREFYADFDNPNGNRCSIDVAKELIKLKEQKVDGVVLDLRDNGGGSLGDVVEMVGLFVDQGPVVQVKGREGRPMVLQNHAKTALYTGPFTVMVNEFSASASEIFAAAIQDYKRGVIIGSTSTYGKGTVQRPFPLDKLPGFPDPDNAPGTAGVSGATAALGTIHITMQKFYRINGGSTQLRGVTSDIVLPDAYEHYKFREKDQPDALPWDEISKADYTPLKNAYDLNAIKKASAERLKNNNSFNLIAADADWLDRQNDKLYPLNLQKFLDEQKQVRATIKQIQTLNKLPKAMDISFLPEDLSKYQKDEDKAARYNRWLKNLQTDIYLNEAVNVVDDMITQKNLAYSDHNLPSAKTHPQP